MKLTARIAAFGLGIALSTTIVPARAEQVHMEDALATLQTAEHQLQVAEEDKGGHRAKALQHVQAAIKQIEAGIHFAQKHPK